MRTFKCNVLSDTHMSHFDFSTIGGDILFHCGDVTNNGKLSELKDFASWLEEQNYIYKIIIGGNHDYCIQDSIEESRKLVAPALILQNELIEIDGLKIFGSPYSVRYGDWANMKTEMELKDEIMEWPSAHVILTHGPAKGLLDWNGYNNWGSESYRLKLEMLQESKTKLFMFGHIHEAYGFGQFNNLTIINAAVAGMYNSALYPEPINFEICFDENTSSVTEVIIIKDG